MKFPATVTEFPGGLAIDDRGSLRFVAGLPFAGIKRFYIIENFSTATIRAWHGHLKEAKIIYPLRGAAIVAAVLLSNPRRPSKKTKPERFVLSAKKLAALYIPAGYANGFKILEEGTSLIFFSTSTVEESKQDDYRFPADYWGNNIWEVANR